MSKKYISLLPFLLFVLLPVPVQSSQDAELQQSTLNRFVKTAHHIYKDSQVLEKTYSFKALTVLEAMGFVGYSVSGQ